MAPGGRTMAQGRPLSGDQPRVLDPGLLLVEEERVELEEHPVELDQVVLRHR